MYCVLLYFVGGCVDVGDYCYVGFCFCDVGGIVVVFFWYWYLGFGNYLGFDGGVGLVLFDECVVVVFLVGFGDYFDYVVVEFVVELVVYCVGFNVMLVF